MSSKEKMYSKVFGVCHRKVQKGVFTADEHSHRKFHLLVSYILVDASDGIKPVIPARPMLRENVFALIWVSWPFIIF